MSPAEDGAAGGMFRQQALDRVSARDTLEGLLTVTSARLWLALAACLTATAAAVIWATTGSAPTMVNGIGIMLPPSGIVEVTALATGTVTTLPSVGTQVAAGHSVTTVTAPGQPAAAVDAPIAGTIDQILVARGDFVAPGTPVAELLPRGAPIAALLFVGAAEGKTLRPGMPASISPTTAPASQYGSITGVVSYVSPLPLTQQRLNALLGDRPGIISSVSQLGYPLEVIVTLHHSRRGASGYAWTSGQGPPFSVTPGTLLTGSVEVSRQSPATTAFSGQ